MSTALLRHVSRSCYAAASDRQLLERFATGREADAFAALLERHAGLVYGVCRRVLRDDHLAADAFQATFLVLATKAGAVRRGELLANWLFGVARRLALKARHRQQRAAERDRIAAARRPEAVEPRPWDDLVRALVEELHRLPDRLRRPLLACYFDGLTQDAVASELRLSVRTLRRRLDRGRELLRMRLAARGATLSAGLLVATLAPTAVDAGLIDTTLRAALGGTATPAVAQLAAGVPALAAARLRMLACVAMTALLLVGGLGWRTAGPAPAEQPADPPPAPRRDRFNDPLPAGAVARIGTVGFRHGDGVDGLWFAPDGKSLVSRSRGTLRRWQADTGHEIGHIDGLATTIGDRNVHIVADHRSAVVVFHDRKTAEVWDLTTLTRRKEVNLRTPRLAGISHAAVSPDGRRLALRTNQVELWDLDEGRETHRLDLQCHILTFTADGKRLITSDGRGQLDIWNAATGEHLKSFASGPEIIDRMLAAPGGRWLATSDYALGEVRPLGKNLAQQETVPGKRIRIWDVEKGELACSIPIIRGIAENLAFAPDGSALYGAFPANPYVVQYSIRAWNIPSGRERPGWKVELPRPGALAISADGATLAVAGFDDGCIRLWDVRTQRELTPTEAPPAAVRHMQFSPNGRQLWTDVGGERLEWDSTDGRLLRRSTKKQLTTVVTLEQPVTMPQPANGPPRSAPGRLRVIDENTGETVHDLGTSQIRGWGLTHDAARVCAIDGDTPSRFRCWDTASGKLLHEWPVTAQNFGATFLAGPGNIILIIQTHVVAGYELATGKERFRWDFADTGLVQDRRVGIIYRLSPDGRTIACGLQAGGGVVLCETATGRIVRHLKDPAMMWRPLAFAPDGKRLAASTGQPSPAVLVWDIATGEKLHEWRGHHGEVTGLAFSPDGRRLASGSRDCTALIWDVPPRK